VSPLLRGAVPQNLPQIIDLWTEISEQEFSRYIDLITLKMRIAC